MLLTVWFCPVVKTKKERSPLESSHSTLISTLHFLRWSRRHEVQGLDSRSVGFSELAVFLLYYKPRSFLTEGCVLNFSTTRRCSVRTLRGSHTLILLNMTTSFKFTVCRTGIKIGPSSSEAILGASVGGRRGVPLSRMKCLRHTSFSGETVIHHSSNVPFAKLPLTCLLKKK